MPHLAIWTFHPYFLQVGPLYIVRGSTMYVFTTVLYPVVLYAGENRGTSKPTVLTVGLSKMYLVLGSLTVYSLLQRKR